ncbi:MAG: O-succinylbenzoic acid--CoA ligase, partial [Bacteroidota bacterium]
MAPTYKNVHNRFKLNGLSFSREELKEVGYSLVKEGEDYEKSIGDFLLDWLSDIPTLQVKTSGSTGTPKLITLQKQLMVNSAMATGDFFKTSVGNSALLCLPCDYIAGKMMLVRAMILGWALDYVQPTSQPLATTSKTYDFAA